MIKVILTSLLFTSSFVLADAPGPSASPSPSPSTCPDLSGHYQHKQLGATADAYVTQTACASMEIKVDADVLGKTYNEDASSPLDGVSRQYPSPNTDEADYASAEFKGSTVVFMVERDVTSNGKVTKSYNEVQGVLTSPNVLEITEGDVDSNGNLSNTQKFNFNRVQ